MITFLYWLPFILMGFNIAANIYCYSKKLNYHTVLHIDEDTIRMKIAIIPGILVILAFWFAVPNFKELYVPWLLYLIYNILYAIVEFVIYRARQKKAYQEISNFTNDLKRIIKERENEE